MQECLCCQFVDIDCAVVTVDVRDLVEVLGPVLFNDGLSSRRAVSSELGALPSNDGVRFLPPADVGEVVDIPKVMASSVAEDEPGRLTRGHYRSNRRNVSTVEYISLYRHIRFVSPVLSYL